MPASQWTGCFAAVLSSSSAGDHSPAATSSSTRLYSVQNALRCLPGWFTPAGSARPTVGSSSRKCYDSLSALSSSIVSPRSRHRSVAWLGEGIRRPLPGRGRDRRRRTAYGRPRHERSGCSPRHSRHARSLDARSGLPILSALPRSMGPWRIEGQCEQRPPPAPW